MMRKLVLATLLFGQILLFTVAIGNGTARAEGGPEPPCGPCLVR